MSDKRLSVHCAFGSEQKRLLLVNVDGFVRGPSFGEDRQIRGLRGEQRKG